MSLTERKPFLLNLLSRFWMIKECVSWKLNKKHNMKKLEILLLRHRWAGGAQWFSCQVRPSSLPSEVHCCSLALPKLCFQLPPFRGSPSCHSLPNHLNHLLEGQTSPACLWEIRHVQGRGAGQGVPAAIRAGLGVLCRCAASLSLGWLAFCSLTGAAVGR